MWRHVAANAMTLLIVALVVAAGVIALAKARYEAPGPLAQAVCLRVPGGSNMARVSADLEELGAISDARIFRIGANYSGQSRALKAGSFLIPEGASMDDIVQTITGSGVSTCGTEVVFRIGVTRSEAQVRRLDPATSRYVEVVSFDTADAPPAEYSEVRAAGDTRYRVTLAEGTTSWQVVEALKSADFLTGDVPEVPPEGSLAPDSYEVVNGGARAELVARMRAAQAERLAAAWANRSGDVPVTTPEEALVLASLIEKETGVSDERRLVASVFVNRLQRGMKLQTDPAVIYGVTGGKGALGRGLRQSELTRPTPYNTYVIDGLPPGPIANPGLASIEAALNPDRTDFLFFVADGTGGHAFARTLAEHNQNVARWRAIEQEQNRN